jgi:hypothetical protein
VAEPRMLKGVYVNVEAILIVLKLLDIDKTVFGVSAPPARTTKYLGVVRAELLRRVQFWK